MSSMAMRQLEERHMATKLDLMVWSNKMDLLALSNVKGEVFLHRLSWQKVWSLMPPAEDVTVSGISWRPDGKVIALAYDNNDLLLVSVENKEIIHRTNYNTLVGESTKITLLTWLEEKGTITDTKFIADLQEKAAKNLPKLLPISTNFGSINEESNDSFEDTKKIGDQTDLNFLVIAFNNGQLFINIFGLFLCGIIQLPSEVRENSKVVGVEMSSDLKNMYCLLTVNDHLRLVTFNTSVFAMYGQEIHALAFKYGLILSLMDYLENTMHSISIAYENMLLQEMESKLSQYASSMPEGTVSADFLELLVFGLASDPLETFLLQDLTDKGIKKLSHSVEVSHNNIQNMIIKHVRAVGRNLLYHLSELKTMSKLSDNYSIIGLQELVVAKSFAELGSFLVKSDEVLLVSIDSTKKYKALFKWLYDVILRLTDERISELPGPGPTDQDITYIAEYLYSLEGPDKKETKNYCYLDYLGQYLKDQNLIKPIIASKNSWEGFLAENPCVQNHPIIVKRDPNASLTQQHKKFQAVIKDMFHYPQQAIGDKITVSSVLTLINVSKSLKISMKYNSQRKELIVAAIPQNNTTTFTVLSLDASHSYFHKRLIYFKSHDLEYGLKTIDLQIYSQDFISVLLEQPGEQRCAVFLQMPLKAIYENFEFISGKQKNIDGTQLVETGALRLIDNMIACKLAVSGARKVAVLLSENMHKVRTYEMEVEEDEEEDDMETTRESDNSSLQHSI